MEVYPCCGSSNRHRQPAVSPNPNFCRRPWRTSPAPRPGHHFGILRCGPSALGPETHRLQGVIVSRWLKRPLRPCNSRLHWAIGGRRRRQVRRKSCHFARRLSSGGAPARPLRFSLARRHKCKHTRSSHHGFEPGILDPKAGTVVVPDGYIGPPASRDPLAAENMGKSMCGVLIRMQKMGKWRSACTLLYVWNIKPWLRQEWAAVTRRPSGTVLSASRVP